MILYRVQSVAGRETPRARLLLSLPAAREVILDPDAADDPNPWRGYRRCLENLGDATHVLVVQDDAVGCRNLDHAIPEIARARPDTLTSLFVGGLPGRVTREFMRALAAKSAWAQLDTRPALNVVALLWPAKLAREFLAWADANQARIPGWRGVPRSDDAVVGAWARLTRQRVFATVPCLFEHPDDVVSVAGHQRHAYGKDRTRVAVRWIGADGDPMGLPWDRT